MRFKHQTSGLFALALLGAAFPGLAQAVSAAELEGCSAIPGDAERLACYDRVSGRPDPVAAPLPGAEVRAATQIEPLAVAVPAAASGPEPLSALSRHWELDDADKQGAFLFRPHRLNYFLPVKYTDSPNNMPFRDALNQPGLGLDKLEAEIQLSFKIKAMQGMFGNDNFDLWFGYTITSFWQAYNDDISSPFRENNYEPEAILTYRTDYEIAGFRGRFINLGILHQSNGRGEDLSRSWNRLYAQVGLERGNLALLIRPWYRIPESDGDDDNPDIENYLGYGDLQLVYHKGRHVYSLLLRNNLKDGDNRGAVKLNWSFPLYGRLKGYAQYFNGYGESLIDYNHNQQSFGLGVSLTEGI